MITKSRITSVFRDLRKIGYFAKQNFWCCQSCAWHDIPRDVEKVVFYHKQDGAAIKNGILVATLYLAWSGDGTQICNVLSSHGLNYEWNGDSDKRIKILAN